MSWKFWSRLFRSKTSGAQKDAVPASREPNPARFPFPLFPSSNREVVALQRLVGNQVVLKMLARPSASLRFVSMQGERESHPERSFWNWFKREPKREEQS